MSNALKKVLIIFVLLFCTLTTGCDKEKPFVVLNSQAINSKTIYNPIYNYTPHQKINYVVVKQQGFTDSVLRIQILKQDDKVSNWGFSLAGSDNICVDKGAKFYIGYIAAPPMPGRYCIRFFELNDLDNEIARASFWVN